MRIALHLAAGTAELDLPQASRLRLNDATLEALRSWLGHDAVQIQCRRYVAPVSEGRRGRGAFAAAVDDDE